MKDTGAETEAYDNPLIPNAKLRQIYGAMVRMRLLGRTLQAQRRRPADAGASGAEACLVSSSVDLGAGDLVSDALRGGVVEFLRGTALERVLRPGETSKKRGVTAGCGSAALLPPVAGIHERIWSTVGASAALKAEAARQKGDEATKQSGVVVVYAHAVEATPAIWRDALAVAAEKELPMLFAILPPASAKGGKTRATGLSAIAPRHGVPGIAVDADDAVAIYRVAQEAIGRARAGGGPALMECVPFVVKGKKRSLDASDAIAGLEEYMLGRRVATKSWMEREAKIFAKQMAR